VTRSESYSALSTIFARGPDETLRPFLADFPGFENVLEHGSTDERAAQFESLFGFNVFPIASVFLETEGMLGGSVSRQVAEQMDRAGFPCKALADPVDHLTTELAFLAYMVNYSATEADVARDFIDRHVLAWLPAFVGAVRREMNPFYTKMAETALKIVYDHRSILGAASARDPIALIHRSFQLDDETSGFLEIAEFLITPAQCGFFLSRSVIAGMAGSHRLPHGFGSRKQMMATSLRSAAAYDRLESLIEELQTIIAKDKAEWQTHAAQGQAAAYWAESWNARLDATANMLETMCDLARRKATD